MIKTKELVDETIRQFDIRFPGDVNTLEEDGVHVRIVSSLYNRDSIKLFLKDYTRTLLEAFGKEIIGKKENEFPMHEQRDFDKIAVRVRNNLKSKQRQKVKEIIKSLE